MSNLCLGPIIILEYMNIHIMKQVYCRLMNFTNNLLVMTNDKIDDSSLICSQILLNNCKFRISDDSLLMLIMMSHQRYKFCPQQSTV